MDDMVILRQRVVEYLQQKLVGPEQGEREVLLEEPHKRYTSGVLYPRESAIDPVIEEDEEDSIGGIGGDEDNDLIDDPLVLANQFLPSSMGMSFYMRDESDLNVRIEAARYLQIEDPANHTASGPQRSGKKRWQRLPISEPAAPDTFLSLDLPGNRGTLKKEILSGMALLNVMWRICGKGRLVTVTVINNNAGRAKAPPPVETCLYQVKVRCQASKPGSIAAYPRTRLLTEDKEEHILDLLYRNQVAYGAGHGCSVVWDEPINQSIREIQTEWVPVCEVPPVSYELEGFKHVLDLHFLAFHDEQTKNELISELTRFVQGYQTWINNLTREHTDIAENLIDARNELLERLCIVHQRMEEGVRLLEKDAVVRKAFCMANLAMLQQRLHTEPAYAGNRHRLGESGYQEPEDAPPGKYSWRPFQLAFQLLTIASVAFPDDAYRNTVDLIWFPTGGGKTEAYLVITAFLIFYRRMSYGTVADGTAVLMRYTLRLLTTQQFRRAATLICACEQLRRQHPEDLGHQEISIGLWVGQGTTPNTFQDAVKECDELFQAEEPKSRFQIDRCPWCGIALFPQRRHEEKGRYGVKATNQSFEMFCPEHHCPFHTHLPIGMVDDQLYAQPPTLLLGTVDKFARMPWESRVIEFFGGNSRRPPELIIQDELHLISGPLGTMVGMYEVAIDALASWEGVAPKIIASTATIRRADEQSMSLYARNVSLFPPSGLDASDSYFARYDYTRPGRLYLGILGASHTASTTMIRTSAALLQAPVDLELEGEQLDAYWTLVAYHNSLRELGKSRTFGFDDIPARIKVIAKDQQRLRKLNDDNVQELTSNLNAARLGEMLGRLDREAGEDEEVSFLLCTNMLSVGVDVQRLGIMLVNGQPKSTSEYIQATSRVGRGRVPGLVICVYSPSKPRDRSHYERFVGYHSTLYRQVEPTSVTTFAPPVRVRALHAVLVTLVRYKAGLAEQKDASNFSRTLPGVAEIVELLKKRVEIIDPQEAEATARQLASLLKDWEEWASTYDNLEYSAQHKAKKTLLYSAGMTEREVGWETLNSMRNVDRSCLINIMGE